MFIVSFLLLITFVRSDCGSNKYRATNGECVSCSDTFGSNCSECTPTYCTSCASGTYLSTVFECVSYSSVSDCAEIVEGECVQCNDGFYLDIANNNKCTSCNSLVTNCSRCNSRECFKCTEGNYLSNGGQTCKLTPSSPDPIFGQCDFGYYFDPDALACAHCMDLCALCTSSTNCLVCNEGLVLEDPSSSTSKCVTIDNCVTVVSDHCEECASGYYINGRGCSSCPSNCSYCEGTTCLKCDPFFFLHNSACVETIENCKLATSDQGCLECNEGFYYDTTQNTCNTCNNCPKCSSYNDCLECDSGYYLLNGVCVYMDEYCEQTDLYGCVQCQTNTTNTTLADAYMTEENLGDDNNITFSYYLRVSEYDSQHHITYERECQLCSERCKLCEFYDNWCVACNEPYALVANETATEIYSAMTNDFDKTIYSCQTKPDTCLTFVMGYCTECKENHFLSNISCVECDESCSSCVTQTYCNSCNEELDDDENAIYWRPPSISSLSALNKGYCFLVNESLSDSDYRLDMCEVAITVDGCSKCLTGFYMYDNYCVECPTNCAECKMNDNETDVICSSCSNNMYLENNVCQSCDNIENCEVCNSAGCETCVEGYSVSSDRRSCSTSNLGTILPLVGGGGLIIILLVTGIIFFIWWRQVRRERRSDAKARKLQIEDFDEMVKSADNDKFPLTTNTWKLDFDLGSKPAEVDQEYTQLVKVINPSKKSKYLFHLENKPSHCYNLDIQPKQYFLNANNVVDIKFTIKMLCTTDVNEYVSIVARTDEDDDVEQEVATFHLVIASELSFKLDHELLNPIAPPLGEGSFGIVFRGKYGNLDVAIKKMKARVLIGEQKEEFDHEILILQTFRYDPIIKFIGAVYTENEYAIVTEFAEYGNLSKIWGKYEVSFELKMKILDDLACALNYIHHLHYIHRDVKGENVLLTSINPNNTVCGKLSDLELLHK
ncbi:Serine-threonine protein kinase [Entamoeba marina]